MQSKHQIINRAASFVLRIWWEKGEASPIWRGRVQHAASGDSRYFQTVAELLDFVERHAGNLDTQEEKYV
jgi:hypothetical protein